jgi:ribonucleoside-diphosphate reductase alpha chain
MTQAAGLDSRYNVVEMHSAAYAKSDAGKWTRFFTKEGTHPFDEIEWKVVDARIVDPKGNIVFEQKNVEVPAWWGNTTVGIVADKYLRVVHGSKEQSVKQMIKRVAETLRSWAETQLYFNTTQDANTFEDELCYVLLHQYGAFNSPVWFNIGVPGRKQVASACFISGVKDTLDDIMDFQKSEVKIFAGGSGSGANLSDLRSSYEKLSSGSYTSGPMSWMKGLDKYADAMKSGGSTRNAAKMIVMDMNHPDVLETRDGRPGFIRCKAASEKIVHDLAKLGYSVAYDDPNSVYKLVPYQNANHSVSITNKFMQAVEMDGDWVTVERTTGKTVRTYRARDLWREISDAAWTCGDPGIQFTDTINEWHTTPKAGRIKSSNPCSEFLNVDNTACNLAAINLTKFFDGHRLVFDKLAHVVRVLVTAQNAIINSAEYPTKIIKENSVNLRPIGLNYGNLGSLIMKLGYGYDSDEGRAVAARTASLMTGLAYLTSAKLASKVGPFPAFNENRDDMFSVIQKHVAADANICNRWGLEKDPLGAENQSAFVWKEVLDLGKKYGYSVSQATLQAPLGTLSFLMEMDTTGIEPMFSLVSYKSLVGGGTLKLVCSAVKDALLNLGYSETEAVSICKYVEDFDSIEDAPGFNSAHLPVFDGSMSSGKSERCLTPMAHVKMLAAIQPLITCAISKTVNLPETSTVDEISDIYMEAWKLGVKCIALYRDKCKMSQPLASKLESVPVSNTQPKELRRRLPPDVFGHRHRFTIGGSKGYLMMNEYPDGTLGEVFLKLGKTGSTVAGLIDGFTQLLSLALQYGVPLDKMIRSFVHTKFDPAGYTDNPNIRFTDSLYDYLFKILDTRYYDGSNSGLLNQATLHSELEDGHKEEVSFALPPPPFPTTNMSAPVCSSCGSITRRVGTCYMCLTCGTSTGCS